jgi:hypothetical protein
VSNVSEAGWVPGPVWTGADNLSLDGIRSPDRLACSQLLYRLSYPGPRNVHARLFIYFRGKLKLKAKWHRDVTSGKSHQGKTRIKENKCINTQDPTSLN